MVQVRDSGGLDQSSSSKGEGSDQILDISVCWSVCPFIYPSVHLFSIYLLFYQQLYCNIAYRIIHPLKVCDSRKTPKFLSWATRNTDLPTRMEEEAGSWEGKSSFVLDVITLHPDAEARNLGIFPDSAHCLPTCA